MRPNYPPIFDVIVDFICEKGMTFRELIDSEYNESLTSIDGNSNRLCFDIVTLPNKPEIIACKTTAESGGLLDTSLVANLDDVIIENTTYETAY